MDTMLGLALPAGAIVFTLVCYALHKISIWHFDRKHPGLSRNGMRAVAEDRATRSGTPLPSPLGPWMPTRGAFAPSPESSTFDLKRRRFVRADDESAQGQPDAETAA